MSTERDQGIAALKSGDVASAITYLEAARQADPNDYQTCMYLGAAYGQASRDNDAIGALTGAVQIEPANAQARFNLGVALERAGWPNEALTAYQQAVTLQPDYQNALVAVQRLSQPATPTAPPPAAPPVTSPSGMADYSQPDSDARMAEYANSQTTFSPPSSQAPAAQPAQQQQVYGQPQPTQAMSQQPAYGAPPTAQPSPYGQPAAPSPYGAPSPYAGAGMGYAATPYYEDRFDLKQAFIDWLQVIKAPQAFFQDQAGREGLKAPCAIMLAYLIVNAIVTTIAYAAKGNGGMAIAQFFASLIGYPFLLLGVWISARLYHWVSRWFGGTAGFDGSFRVVAYASAPGYVLGLILAVLMVPAMSDMPKSPGFGSRPDSKIVAQSDTIRLTPVQFSEGGTSGKRPGGLNRTQGAPGGMDGETFPTTPRSRRGTSTSSDSAQDLIFKQLTGRMAGLGAVGIIVSIISFCWNLALLVIGFSAVQRISTGSAFGMIATLWIILFAIVVVLVILFAGALIAMIGTKGMH